MWHNKADVRTKKLLVECKRTDKASYTVKLAELQKINVEAHRAGKMPVLALEIQRSEYVILKKEDFEALTADEQPEEGSASED